MQRITCKLTFKFGACGTVFKEAAKSDSGDVIQYNDAGGCIYKVYVGTSNSLLEAFH